MIRLFIPASLLASGLLASGLLASAPANTLVIDRERATALRAKLPTP